MIGREASGGWWCVKKHARPQPPPSLPLGSQRPALQGALAGWEEDKRGRRQAVRSNNATNILNRAPTTTQPSQPARSQQPQARAAGAVRRPGSGGGAWAFGVVGGGGGRKWAGAPARRG